MMRLKKQLILGAVFCASLSLGGAVFAQDGTAINADDLVKQRANDEQKVQDAHLSAVEKGIAEAEAELLDDDLLRKKLSLAKKMHKIRPTSEQVDSAVARASLGLPVRDRENFVMSMRSILNYNAIEKISIDAMVSTYTLVELKSMVEYYSKPEAQSASKKIFFWGGKVQPEIVNMIDKAMMRLRTGN